MFVLGVFLNLVSAALCVPVQNPLPFFIVGAGAFVSVFFDGYRGIFIGFITTFGVVLLILAITCGAMIALHK